jgi:hypothetical protein
VPDRQHARVPLRHRLIVLVALSTLAGAPSSYAASKLRVFGTGLFVTGVGLKFAGVLARGSAQRIYDDYLTTAVQSEIAQLRDDYRSKRRVGTSLSNAGNAYLVTGALLTALSALRATEADAVKSLSAQTNGNALVVAFNRRF